MWIKRLGVYWRVRWSRPLVVSRNGISGDEPGVWFVRVWPLILLYDATPGGEWPWFLRTP